ncbi:MAG: tetratricopeptide repeat protein [Helicobacteraceae bacterium]|jgi:tetratricopeptide (TPR) repeat protein|nr:tetratricopeptide repeat protein [Helicobacteraceae bacterium]
MRTITKAALGVFLATSFAFATDNAFGRGVSAFGQRDYQEEIKHYSIAVEENPNDAKAYYSRADAYYELKDYAKAIADYSQALKIDPNYVGAYYGRVSAYVMLDELKQATQYAREACELGYCDALEVLKEEYLIDD